MKQEIYIIDETNELYDLLMELFKNEKKFVFKKVLLERLEQELINIPSLIIINEDTISQDATDVANMIKENDDNSITPVIVVSSNIDKKHRVKVLKAFVGQYIKKPIDKEYFYYTIKNLIRLLYTNREVSPLTGLPGNSQIQAEMKKRILKKEYFVMLYLDLDNFKSYNDTYGFSQGDELIKFTGRTIVQNVQKIDSDNGFIGHIGGDDFIAIISKKSFEKLCQNIIIDFDNNVVNYFLEEHVRQNFIEVENRKGVLEQFPLTSISIGVVEIEPGRFKSPLEIGEVGAQVKKLSKTVQGSTYVVNKRS